MSIQKSNTNIDLLKTYLQNYYNNLIVNKKDPASNQDYFPEMNDIKSIPKDRVSIPQPTTDKTIISSTKNFTIFIATCLNWQLTSSRTDTSMLKNNKLLDVSINSTPAGTITDNLYAYNDIIRHINVINVIIDILEAYKYIIDNNSTSFKEKLYKIDTIRLVSQQTRFDAIAEKNYAYIDSRIGENVLMLCIKSFNNNDVFTKWSSTEYNIPIKMQSDFITTDNGIVAFTQNGHKHERQEISNVSRVIKHNGTVMNTIKGVNEAINGDTVNYNVQNRDRAIIQNFLYFLIRMNKDDARTQVYALYYYYKIVRLYALLICASVNIAIFNVKGNTKLSYIKINSVSGDNATNPLDTDDVKYMTDFLNSYEQLKTTPNTAVTPETPTNIKKMYDKIYTYVSSELSAMNTTISTTSNSRDLSFVNIPLALKIPQLSESTRQPANASSLKLYYTNSDKKTAINNAYGDVVKKKSLMDNFEIVYKGIGFKILNINTTDGSEYIEIEAKFDTNYDTNNIPLFGENYVVSDIALSNIYIQSKSLTSLKSAYSSGKSQLVDINSNIKNNTLKINNQKNLFNYQKSKYDLLQTQITTYTTIFSIIVLVIIGMYIVDAGKDTKRLVALICGVVILMVVIIYYFVNISYLQENFNNIEHFAVPASAASITDATTDQEKMDLLEKNLLYFNNIVLSTLQQGIAVIPLKESSDFYNELNNVIKIERDEKQGINNILTYKKSLGNSNIDVLKYENNNMKVYLFVLLTSFTIFSLLYILSIYLPSDYNSLIGFVAVIFAVILFSYYLIFTHQVVRTKSYHKYWGPSKVNNN